MDSVKFKRQPAKRIHVKEIFEGFIDQNISPNVLSLNSGEKFYRVRLIGIIINKFNRETLNFNSHNEDEKEIENSAYTALDLDDGTGVISIRGWGDKSELLDEFEIGDILEIIGRPREYQGLIYVQFENGILIKDLHWLLYHELINKIDKSQVNIKINPPKQQINNIIKENEFVGNEEETQINLDSVKYDNSESITELLFEIISKEKSGKGISYDSIKSLLKKNDDEEIKSGLINLLDEGLIYEPKPKLYKIL